MAAVLAMITGRKDCQRTASSRFMDIARMLNVTILACLLILTGCFGLFDDGDVIDDAEGDDGHDEETSEGSENVSTTVVNNYHYDNTTSTVVSTFPSLQSMVGNGTISTSAGDYLELNQVWYQTCRKVGFNTSTQTEIIDCEWQDYTISEDTLAMEFNCTIIHGFGVNIGANGSDGGELLPSDGTACDYSFTIQTDPHSHLFGWIGNYNIIYRVWS